MKYRCYEPVTIGLLAIAAGGSIYSGMQQNAAAKRTAGLQEEQARLALQESKSNAEVEAYNQNVMLNKQKLAFIKSGVSLEGSPLDVLENTRQWGQKSVDAILKGGVAQYNYGMASASNTKASGRAALIGGYTQAAGTLGTAALSANNAGLLGTKTAKTTSSSYDAFMYGGSEF